MRADVKVTLITYGEEHYNEQTGNYEVENDDKIIYAYVTDTGTERMQALYGGPKQYAKTIRANQRVEHPPDEIWIDDRRYKSDRRKVYRHKTVIEASGV